MKPVSILILGSTGSIGVNTLRIIRDNPGRFRVAGLAAGSNAELLSEQIAEFKPERVYLKDGDSAKRFPAPAGTKLFTEKEGLRAFAASGDYDVLVAASSGTSSLLPVLDAFARKKRVALANKELLVVAGGHVMKAVAANPGAELLPVDSEHSAIFQCLEGERRDGVRRLILTGSGGPLREIPAERFAGLSKEFVTNHPKWKMGKKISVDSATMMNKGLEVIEASWLFGFGVERIDVLVHPEAVIHSMVEFTDGSVIAQLGIADMRLPIQYALDYPTRQGMPSTLRLDFANMGSLTFAAADRKKFQCLDLAYEAARCAGSAPCVLSAADEVAVSAFLEDRIGFVEIAAVIEKVLSRHRHVENPGLDEIRAVHDWASEEAMRLCQASSFSS